MYAVQDKNLYVNLYVQSSALIDIANGKVELRQVTEYPWDGKVELTIDPKKVAAFSLKLRIPGWAENSPVPTDLYHFSDKQTTPVEITINGKPITTTQDNGYVSLNRKWKKGDKITVNFPMPIRQVEANIQVEDDKAKIAFERGPVVYCIEAADQADKHVFNKYFIKGSPVRYEYRNDLLNGVVVVTGSVRQIEKGTENNLTEKEVPFTAIPYSTWNNRGANEMAVWIPVKASIARPVPESTIASRAYCVNAWGVNDQWEPKSSADISKPYMYWWLKFGTEETLEYAFEKPETVSNVQVYWLSFDQYERNFRVPERWKLLYKDGETWKEVEALEPYTTLKDCYNSLSFKPVKTTGLKIAAKLQEGESGGVLEWKVN